MLPQFHAVIGNRDILKIQTPAGSVKRPIWEFIEGHARWLTSLVYLRGVERPPGRFLLDCGAWSYKALPTPKWTPAECMAQYATFAQPGDIVAAPDHMVLRQMSAEEEAYRVDVTLSNAAEFLRLVPSTLSPLGVTHGSTPQARRIMTEELLALGYRHIGIGSVAIRAGNRKFIRAILEDLRALRAHTPFYVHVLGVSALSWYAEFAHYGIDSYDGSSMFFSAFTAGEYFWAEGPQLIPFSVKRGTDPSAIPLCTCPPCAVMRAQGVDTRQMGSNEHNMGRAVHNINQYLRAYHALQASTPTVQLGLWDQEGTR